MNILFLTHSYPNYVPDLLLHGLRKILGDHVVDYPRKDCLYEGVLGLGVCPPEQRSARWFPDDSTVDRHDIKSKLVNGYFDYIVMDIRSVTGAGELLQGARYKGLAIVDGEDLPTTINPGAFLYFQRETSGMDNSIPLPMAMPEEILEQISQFDQVEKEYSIGFVGSLSDDNGYRKSIVEILQRHYPDGYFRLSEVASETNPVPDGRLSKLEYYRAMQKCKVLITLRGTGYDTFRYWEHAACNSVNLVEAMPILIPDTFSDNEDCCIFANTDEMKMKIDKVLQSEDLAVKLRSNCRQRLTQYHLTSNRAEYFLSKLQSVYP